MSKYDALWNWICSYGKDSFSLSFTEIEEKAGFPIDHSFLNYKKELNSYGYRVVNISMKNQIVNFEKL